jgi:beta-phosphoglucomutase-like phosphatase (HAD superfamily)
MVAETAPLEAIVFDLDGVLVDSEIWWHEVRVEWAASRGREWTTEDSHAVMGANSPGWARIMRERLGLDPDEEPEIERAIVDGVVDRYRREGPPVIAGAVEATRRLAAAYPVAIASSAHADVIRVALEMTGLDATIPIAVSSDEVEHGKPAPDVYLEAARRLRIAPERCLVVEDSLNGIRAGRAAGMVVVLVPNEHVPPAPGSAELAELVVDHLDQLDPSAVRRRA